MPDHTATLYHLAQLRTSLLRYLSDGKFTVRELDLIRAQRDALGLSPDVVRTLRPEIYHAAYVRAFEDGVISSAEADSLDRLMQFLNESPQG